MMVHRWRCCPESLRTLGGGHDSSTRRNLLQNAQEGAAVSFLPPKGPENVRPAFRGAITAIESMSREALYWDSYNAYRLYCFFIKEGNDMRLPIREYLTEEEKANALQGITGVHLPKCIKIERCLLKPIRLETLPNLSVMSILQQPLAHRAHLSLQIYPLI